MVLAESADLATRQCSNCWYCVTSLVNIDAMRPRELHCRVAATLLVLVALTAKLVGTAKSQEPIFGRLDSNPNISLDPEFKSQASKDETSPEQQNWLFHVQGTEVAQGQPGFHSPYH